MANLFQRIFLSQEKIADINQKQEIINLVQSSPIIHQSYTTKNGYVARRFSIKTPDYNIYAERVCDTSRPLEKQICFSFQFGTHSTVKFATHSDIDKFAETVYKKMYKIWTKNKEKVK